MYFHENLYLCFIQKSFEIIQVLLKYDKKSRYFTRRLLQFYDHTLLNSLQNEKRFRREILCSITFFFFFENRAFCEIMCKNIVQPDRTQMTIRRMHIACWTHKATNTHSEYVILLFHCMNGYENSLHCYIIRTLPV